MKFLLCLILVLYLGGICLSQNEEGEDPLPIGFEQLAEGEENMTPEEAGEALMVGTSDVSQNSSSVDAKFFFWPWWGWWGGGCRKRICYSLGSVASFPVCGYDVNLGFRSFHNSCFLNATNTCFQTNYLLNRTGLC